MQQMSPGAVWSLVQRWLPQSAAWREASPAPSLHCSRTWHGQTRLKPMESIVPAARPRPFFIAAYIPFHYRLADFA